MVVGTTEELKGDPCLSLHSFSGAQSWPTPASSVGKLSPGAEGGSCRESAAFEAYGEH